MKYKSLIYSFALSFATLALAGCSDEELTPSKGKSPNGSESDGPSLEVVVTIDNMGGSRSTSTAALQQIENYIDIEKLRVLFFTCVPKNPRVQDDYDHDYFLFESKSRWVKKMDDAENSWMVNIPLYSAGNDTGDYDWNWDLIRDMLINQDFKIAILANRPDFDYADRFADSDLPAGYLPNDGPVWTTADAVKGEDFASADYSCAKDVFDLHHCQYDRNYLIKSTTAGYYSFIMSGWDENGKSWSSWKYSDLADNKIVKMGASSSWVDWTYSSPNGTGYNDRGFQNTSNSQLVYLKHFRHPSVDYPIPMYGIQRFAQIPSENWLPGSPFELSSMEGQHYSSSTDAKKVSLLRSVVRCDIIIPKTYSGKGLELAAICYSNIYARCEPMDVWTPTDEMWDNEHGTPSSNGYIYPNCELNMLLAHGSICTTTGATVGGSNGTAGGVTEYQETMAWFYGRWKEKGWKFLTPSRGEVKFTYNPNTNYPRIFNPYIQRNQMVICDDNVRIDEGANWHYVVYLGERNITDPSNLNALHNVGAANSISQFWMIQYGDDVYAVPITDYSNSNNPARNIKPIQASVNHSESLSSPVRYRLPDGTYYLVKHQAHDAKWCTSGQQTYKGWYTANNNYQIDVTNHATNESYLPWPLIRNHVYTITLTTRGSSASTGGRSVKDGEPLTLGESFNISSEDKFSKHIGKAQKQ